MKLFPVFMALGVLYVGNVYADCVETIRTYTSCNTGYYLSSADCVICPSNGTSAADNTSGITSCYIPSGQTHSDHTGIYTYTNDCYYGN